MQAFTDDAECQKMLSECKEDTKLLDSTADYNDTSSDYIKTQQFEQSSHPSIKGILKASSNSNFLQKQRTDTEGRPICKGQNFGIKFANELTNVVQIESFKKYNKKSYNYAETYQMIQPVSLKNLEVGQREESNVTDESCWNDCKTTCSIY